MPMINANGCDFYYEQQGQGPDMVFIHGEIHGMAACVQFGLALPMISYFHRLSVTGLSANIIIIPLRSLVVPVGFVSILTGWHALAAANRMLLVIAERVAGWHASFEPAWRMADVPIWLCIAFAGSLVLLAYVIRKLRVLVPVALTASLALFCVICIQPWKVEERRGWMELSAIDVSQGDSLSSAERAHL